MSAREHVESIEALGVAIRVATVGNDDDYISITDIARYRSDEPSAVIANWMRNRDTLAFLGIWESLHKPNFNSVEFEGIEAEAGRNAFSISPRKWVRLTNAIGIRAKGGRYGGAYAHKDIAFEFASWVSPEFKLYVIKDYQRLKSDENSRLSVEWNERRMFSKINYRIHTDAIMEHLAPLEVGQARRYVYADEADVLNVALFGMTARQWRAEHPGADGNIRDYATMHQLLVLANLESFNAQMIRSGIARDARASHLRDMAIQELESLGSNPTIRALEEGAPRNGGQLPDPDDEADG